MAGISDSSGAIYGIVFLVILLLGLLTVFTLNVYKSYHPEFYPEAWGAFAGDVTFKEEAPNNVAPTETHWSPPPPSIPFGQVQPGAALISATDMHRPIRVSNDTPRMEKSPPMSMFIGDHVDYGGGGGQQSRETLTRMSNVRPRDQQGPFDRPSLGGLRMGGVGEF